MNTTHNTPTDRVTVTRPNSTGTRYVRYGTPASFDTLGTVRRLPNRDGFAASPDYGVTVVWRATYAEAVSYLVKAAGL